MSPSGLDPALVDRIARALDLRVFVEVVQRPLDRLQAIRAPFAESRSIPPGESPSQELVQANCLYLMPGVPEGEGPARLIDAIRRVGTLNRRSALVVEDVTGFLTGGALDGEPDLMDLLSALKQLSGDHRLLLTGPAVWYFPPLADAAVREHTGRRGIDWTDTGYRSDQLQEAESRAAAKDQVIAELSRELEAASRDRADKDEFINRLSGELPLMQTLIFVDAKLRRYLGAFLWPLRLVVRLVARTAGRLFAVRLNHDAQYPPRPLPDPGDYRPCPMPANPPVISIVTPSFNQGAFLKDTIDSVTGQAYPRLQYVVQDGGSKDDTVEVLGHASDRLTYWQSRPDGGQANAVNLGMRRVTGDILAWLNSDDLLLPGSLAYVASYFGQHPEIDVVYGNRILIDSQGRDIGRWILPPHDDEVLPWADYVPQETVFWRRGIWEAVGGCLDEDFHFALDWDLLLRFREAGARMARLPRFLGAFRIHDLQKNLTISHVHGREVRKLIARTHGREISAREIHRHMKPFFRRHVVCDRLFRFGLLRYGMRGRFARTAAPAPTAPPES